MRTERATWSRTEIPFVGTSQLVLLVLVRSLPVTNPPIWFCILITPQTTLAHLAYHLPPLADMLNNPVDESLL